MKNSTKNKLGSVFAVIIVVIVIAVKSMAQNGAFGYTKNYEDSYLDSSYITMTKNFESKEIGRMIILKGTVMYKYDEVKDKTVKNAYVLNLGEKDSSLFIVEIKDDTELEVGSSYEVKGFLAAKTDIKPANSEEDKVAVIDSKIIEPICDEEVENQFDLKKRALHWSV